jgi:hypothetical protein
MAIRGFVPPGGGLDGARIAVALAKQREQASDMEAHEGIAEGVVDVCVELAATTRLEEGSKSLGLGRAARRAAAGAGRLPEDGSRDVLDSDLLFDAGA